jgi:hypothetical protein
MNLHYYISKVEECHTINKCGGFEFLSWLLCKDHKNENLCYMICASPLMFDKFYMLLISMLVGLSYDFKGWRDYQVVYQLAMIRVNTHSQVNFLIVCVYYLMWNPKWKVICFCTCAFIVIINLGAMIKMVNGCAWDNQSWSLNKFYLTMVFSYMLIMF